VLVYIGVFTVLTLVGLAISDRKASPYLVIASLFLLLFMGTRYQVGCDFTGYFRRFLVTPTDITVRNFIENFDEPGFWLLTYFVKVNELSYMWLNFFASLIMVACFYVFCRAHENRALILALLFPVIIVQLGMSGIRQGLATAFLMVASISWMRGSRLWTVVWIFVGVQFHASVAMFLPIALVAGTKVSTLRLAGALMIGVPVAVFLLGGRLDTYTDRYIGTDITSGGALIRYTLILMPAVFFVYYRRQLEEAFPDVYELLKLFTLITFSLLPVAVFSSILLHRVNFYVMPFSILTFSYLSLVAFGGTHRLLVRALPALAYGGYSTIWFLTSRHADSCYIPYQSYFWVS
jgi:hypothetical protein